MRGGHLQCPAATGAPGGFDAGEGEQRGFIDVRRSVYRELDDMTGTERRDELAGGVERDHLAVIHDRYVIAEPLGLVHVVRREHRRPAFVAERVDDIP